MREADAKKLKVGDKVMFHDNLLPNKDNGLCGTVIDRDYARFVVEWDDGVRASYPHLLAMMIQRAKA